MTTGIHPLLFSPESLSCAAAKPNRLLGSSRNLGWRGLLLDHQEGVGRSDVFETHPTDDVSLVVATRGRSLIQVFKHGRWHSAVYEPGNAGLTRPLETTRAFWQGLEPDERFETAHLYLSSAIIRETAEEYRRIGTPDVDHPLSSLVFRDETISSVANTLIAAMHDNTPGLYAEQVARFLAGHMLARHAGWSDAHGDHRLPPALADRQLARVLEYMSVHFGRDLTLAELAREAGISIHHFVRRFRERTSLTPFAHLTRLRIETAQRLLRTSDMPVSEVAALCGYSNPGAFSSAFNRELGQSPRSYRMKARIR